MRKKHTTRWYPSTDPSFGPLGEYLENFKAQLSKIGYAQGTIKPKIIIVRHFNKWLYQKELHVKDVHEKTVKKFLGYYHTCHLLRYRLKNQGQLQDFLNWLRQQNLIPNPIPVKKKSKFDYILNDYTHYLKNERGLSMATVRNYVPIVHCFLFKRFQSGEILLKDLVPTDIRKFVFEQTKKYSLRRVQLITTALRSFFRYLCFCGDIKIDLAALVPTVADRSGANLPKYLPSEDINKIIQSCDFAQPAGIRNYALLTLMARLGLRVCEVLKMTLDDINWQEGVITIHGKTGHTETLPLPKDVGQAIAIYLKNKRPKCVTRMLFVESKAPIEGLARSSICSIVRRACQQAGISSPHQGGNLLRHSLATRMLREGATIMDIAEILRHRSLATTEIYAKVDIKSLAELARPWP